MTDQVEIEDPDSCDVPQAAQEPPVLVWVPLDVFLVEMMASLVLFRLFNFWSLGLIIPVHFTLMYFTEKDKHWPRTLGVNIYHWIFVRNKGLRGKNSVTFNAAPLDAHQNDYDDILK